VKNRLNFPGVIDGSFLSLPLLCRGGDRSLGPSSGAGELIVVLLSFSRSSFTHYGSELDLSPRASSNDGTASKVKNKSNDGMQESATTRED
jgi:hypothetical protein